MTIAVQFINFPKSNLIRSSISNRISECIEKFAPHIDATAKAVFSVEKMLQHVKIYLVAGKINVRVNASANDAAHAIDKVLVKLSSSLRRLVTKNKEKRVELDVGTHHATDSEIAKVRYQKRRTDEPVNIFDKYETQYVSDFEDEVYPPKRTKRK